RVTHRCAPQDNRAVVACNSGAQLGDGLVGADLSDLDAACDGVARPNRCSEVPVDVEEYRAGSGQQLCGDRIEDGAGKAALNDDLAESGSSCRVDVVVQWVTVATDLREALDIGGCDRAAHFRNVAHAGSSS